MKKRVAVMFGGRSPEHDVSIVTGLQALEALDQQTYDAFPVYVATDGNWWTGEGLRDRSRYIPSDSGGLESVVLDTGANARGIGGLIQKRSGFPLFKPKTTEFDVALFAFHGLSGEDGRMQSVFDVANVAYTGMRPLAAGVFMDKATTKRVLAPTGIPQLPYAVLDRPASGLMPEAAALQSQLKNLAFPLIVKPMRLGSSIGVARVTTIDELRAALPLIFRLDTQAIVEPFVENLVEYNIAVSGFGGKIATSAIERPKRVDELLSFREKYLKGGQGKAGGQKTPGQHSEGMLSLTRDINPSLPGQAEASLRNWAAECFKAVGGSGAPRIDFLSNERTGEIWLNEVNPCPGSLGFFLWEAAPAPILFSQVLTHLIDEAFALHRANQLPADPTLPEAQLFPRKEVRLPFAGPVIRYAPRIDAGWSSPVARQAHNLKVV